MYKDIEINYRLFNIWDDEFKLRDITNNIVNCDFNHYKCLGYTADICEDNHENNLHTPITDTGIEEDYIHSSSVYSDIDNKTQNSTL